jgi:cytochrome d ubiquinol oxidase subunit II
MSTLTLATICAGLIGLGLIAYAVLGGADFGGGIWDLLATGRYAERERQAVANALGPVWEANNVWLVYVIVVTWTAFPAVYATVSTALFVPVVLVLIGIICRGAAFGFRSHYGRQAGMASVWGRVFSVASSITPFLLGMIAGTIARGAIQIVHGAVSVNYLTVWISPFSFACGAFAIGLCSVLAATYLTVEAQSSGDLPLVAAFLVRALVAGAVTALIGAIAAILAKAEAPVLWAGLTGSALPLSLAAVLIGLATAATLLLGYYAAARLLVAAETACIFAAWGVAQYPYLIVPSLTLANAATTPSVLVAVIIASGAGMVILFPSLWYLFHIFKGPSAQQPKVTAAQLANDGFARAWAATNPAGGDKAAARTAKTHIEAQEASVAADAPTRRDPPHSDAGPTQYQLLSGTVIAVALVGMLYACRRAWRRLRELEE